MKRLKKVVVGRDDQKAGLNWLMAVDASFDMLNCGDERQFKKNK